MPFPPPGDLIDAGIEPGSPALGADALTSEPGIDYFINLKKKSHCFLKAIGWKNFNKLRIRSQHLSGKNGYSKLKIIYPWFRG